MSKIEQTFVEQTCNNSSHNANTHIKYMRVLANTFCIVREKEDD